MTVIIKKSRMRQSRLKCRIIAIKELAENQESAKKQLIGRKAGRRQNKKKVKEENIIKKKRLIISSIERYKR